MFEWDMTFCAAAWGHVLRIVNRHFKVALHAGIAHSVAAL
jgi:hypothetical protein